MGEQITLDHGSGGRLTLELIREVFNTEPGLDAAILGNLAFTTDSHSIKPLFFNGGDIGKLAISGTVNDLLCVGAKPLYISSAFIIEAGFEIDKLKKIVESMKNEAENAGVEIVCGDTKVVENGKCDGVYINTSGIGRIVKPITSMDVSDGDVVIVTGTIGDHGFAILNEREKLAVDNDLKSDAESLTGLILPLLESDIEIKMMRDPTRGGLAMCLNELCLNRNFGFEIEEERIPIKEEVRVLSELLGIEPYYSANEGKMVLVVERSQAECTLDKLKQHPSGRDAAIIGHINADTPAKVILKTRFGTKRLLRMPVSDKMPRIC